MTIKIQCPCGAKYAFEVAPECAARPVTFVCQQCGLDSSAAVNQIIRQQFGAAAAPPAEPKPGAQTPPAAAAAAPVACAASPAPGPPPQRVHVPTSATPSTPKPAAQPAPAPVAAVAAASAPAAQVCRRHGDQVTVSECAVCHKPICPKCLEQFGYLCSAYCKAQAEKLELDVPVYEFQKHRVEANYWRKVRWISAGIALLVLSLLGVWGWYLFIGSHPKVIYSVKLREADSGGFCRLISPDDVLMRHGDRLVRYDVKQRKEVWSTVLVENKHVADMAAAWLEKRELEQEKWKLARARLKASGKLDEDFPEPAEEKPRSEAEQLKDISGWMKETVLHQLRFHVQGSDIWVVYPDRAAHFDWQTGKPDKEVPVPGKIVRTLPAATALVLVSAKEPSQQMVTRISLPAGEVQTSELEAAVPGRGLAAQGATPEAAPTNRAPAKPGRAQPTPANAMLAKVAQTQSASTNSPRPRGVSPLNENTRAIAAHTTPIADGDEMDAEGGPADLDASGTVLLNAGENVAQVATELLEKKLVQYRTMKDKPATSAFDGDINAAAAPAIYNEILNEWQEQRTGGVRVEDESRYRVTLKRLLAGDTADWTGEVTGPPTLFPLRSVDVLIAGKGVVVLDKANKKLWEAKLNYTVAPGLLQPELWNEEEAESFVPCVEREQSLYLFDQGVLTAFELATGNVRWRLPSVGVSRVQFDRQGMMYVTTTTAGHEQIKYSEQIDVTRKTFPVIMKIDPRTGKTEWTLTRLGERCRFSGPFFYALESSAGEGGDLLHLGAPEHVRISRLHPRDGRLLWEYYEKKFPVDIEFQNNTILLLFRNELRVLRFLTL